MPYSVLSFTNYYSRVSNSTLDHYSPGSASHTILRDVSSSNKRLRSNKVVWVVGWMCVYVCVRSSLCNGVMKNKTLFRRLTLVLKRAIRVINNVSYYCHTGPTSEKLGILKLHNVFDYHSLLFVRDYVFNTLPSSFNECFPR